MTARSPSSIVAPSGTSSARSSGGASRHACGSGTPRRNRSWEDGPRGVLISKGPGDPAKLPTVVTTVKELVSSGTPVMGICLGHHLLGLAAGATTNRLPYGPHGGNTVRDLASGRVTFTTQNHEFQVVADAIPPSSGFEVSHVNLNDEPSKVCGTASLPVFSVQYHPEGCPPPEDSQPLFDEVLRLGGSENGKSSATATFVRTSPNASSRRWARPVRSAPRVASSPRPKWRTELATSDAFDRGWLNHGLWFQWDYADGPFVNDRRTWLWCAWLAWSRFRVVLSVRG
jgi:anthranilate/para-aminobenzoate synthase component II